MDMPGILNIYFNAGNGDDAAALSKAFAVNAVVEDEGACHQGVAEIREWWVTAKTAARYVAEPLETVTEGDKALVRTRVSGEFPGSPVTLTYGFVLRDDKIVRLEIR